MPRTTVSFEFASVEEAVLFLGKQIPEVAKAVVVSAPAVAAAPAAPPAVESEKRGRGRPADPNSRRSKAAKKTEVAAGGGSSPAAPAATAPETTEPEKADVRQQPSVPASAGEPSVAPATVAPSKQDLVDAMQNIMDTKGIDSVLTTLAKFGVEGAGQLPEAKRAEFIAYCTKVAKGEIEAGK
jgi:hypothetical protein